MKFDWSSFGIEQGSSIDGNTVSQVQKKLGVIFPKSYLDLVTYSDEASPEVSSFSYGDEGTCISEFFSFSPDATPYTISWYSGAGKPLGLPDGMIPIARDAGGYLVCLNFKTPSISVEVFDPNSSSTYFVASNFDDFVRAWSE
ncbi:SMI1/KNR4 family protein [Pseudomonas chlororaphis]|uniref:SMI1/KNR4 family protein n=1 Tax=Pseudomonas chlororaphis TaxID=587753 RepID=UPI001F14BA1C|nr:SMI1/KNR4 family protein [Pseudomonas chlororaphis]